MSFLKKTKIKTAMLQKFKFNSIAFLFFLFFNCMTSAQTTYEKAYFIDNHQNKTECLIKNLDWKNNPESFNYKLSETSEVLEGDIVNVSKFEIYDSAIFIRKSVEIEQNSSNSNKLTYSEKLNLKDKTVFLKLLVGGKTNLYVFKDANSKLFYYEPYKDIISLLEYKKYINTDDKITENSQYKRQLWNDIKCNSIDVNAVNSTDYKESDLIALFKKYDSCENNITYTFKEKKQKNVFNVRIRPAINFSKTDFDGPGSSLGRTRDFDFDNQITFGLGVELEYILPFNNNKWALIFEPTYQYYNTEKTFDTNPRDGVTRIETSTVKYSSIELPFGFRHYSYLNANSRVFVDFSALIDIPFGTEVKYGDTTYKSKSGGSLVFGLGYSYKNKYSVEVRVFTPRDILNDFITVSSDYQKVSLIFGYSLF